MRRRADDRGAVAIFVAVNLTVLVTLAAFAVDLGMQRVVRRDMQALADLVALDLARELDGRSISELAPEVDLTKTDSALAASLGRNDEYLGEDLDVDVAFGTLTAGGFVPMTTSTDDPTAVEVIATAEIGFAFAAGSGSATRSAVATTIKAACYAVGSFAARFRSEESAVLETLVSPLNELLRPKVDLDLVDYTGLASARATLDELAVAAGAASTEAFLSSQVTTADLATAGIAVLQKEDPVNTVAVDALQDLAEGKGQVTTPVLLTKVINVSPTDTAALQADLDLLDLVGSTILVADGVNGFKLGNGNLGAKIAGVATLTTASLSVIERPRMACGSFGNPASIARTSQISGIVDSKFELPTINLGGGDVIQTSPASVLLSVNLGNTEAQLSREPTCRAGTLADPDLIDVGVQSGLATYSLATTLGFRTTLNIVEVGSVEVTWKQAAAATRAMPNQLSEAELKIPPNDDTPVSTGTGDPTLGGVTVANVATDVVATTKVAGLSVPVDLALVEPLLQPIVNTLAVHTVVDGRLDTLAANVDSYLTPLLTLLGINVAGADLFALGRPTCASPVLRG